MSEIIIKQNYFNRKLNVGQTEYKYKLDSKLIINADKSQFIVKGTVSDLTINEVLDFDWSDNLVNYLKLSIVKKKSIFDVPEFKNHVNIWLLKHVLAPILMYCDDHFKTMYDDVLKIKEDVIQRETKTELFKLAGEVFGLIEDVNNSVDDEHKIIERKES